VPLSLRISLVAMLVAMSVIGSHAQTFTSLASFNRTDGANPLYTYLAQGLDGEAGSHTGTGAIDARDNHGCGGGFVESGEVGCVAPSGAVELEKSNIVLQTSISQPG
jgi:hypothetical protein